MPAMKTWKTRPPHYTIIEILTKKGDMVDDDLFDAVKEEYEDLGFKDFNELLMHCRIWK